MHVLFIAMEFPPLNVAGVYRPMRFLNSLVEKGITPVVLTFAVDDNFKKNHRNFDEQLLNQLDPRIIIERIPMQDISMLHRTKLKSFLNIYFNATDNYLKAWKENFYKAIPGIIKKYSPTAIITTCPPFSSAVLAKNLSVEYKLPLIVDMRDAWSEWAIVPFGSYFHYLNRKNEERKVFEQADAIISVTPQLLNKFKAAHPSVNKNKFHLIYNTSTTENYSDEVILLKPIDGEKVIKIGYSGSFYYQEEARKSIFTPWWKKRGHKMLQYTPVKEDWLYRSPYFFLQAFSGLLKKRKEWEGKIEFHYNGEITDWLLKMITETGLKNSVKLNGFLSKKEVEQKEQEYDLLLTTSEKVIGGEHFCLPSKLFSYLKSAKPIIGFVTPGIQKDFLQQCGIGIAFDPDAMDTAVNQLEQLFTEGYTGRLNKTYLNTFSNKNATGLFCNIVSAVTKHPQTEL
mgnify:CR=1 FL=1